MSRCAGPECLPYEPLERFVAARIALDTATEKARWQPGRRDRAVHATTVARFLGVHRSQVQHWRAGRPVRWWKADELAIRLGVHPVDIWPDYYHADVAVDEWEEVA